MSVCFTTVYGFQVDTTQAGIRGVLIGLVSIGVALLGHASSRETTYLVALLWQLGIVVMSFLLLLYQIRKPAAD